MKKIIIWSLLVFSGTELYAQTQPPTLNLPEILPPSTAEMIKFIDHPVDLAHGLASVEIPLYVIKEGDIEVPITLKYHGAGLKVNETNGRVGLGWNLDLGPSLSRQINNMPDEADYLSSFRHAPGQNSNYVELTYLRDLAEGRRDEYPDTFYYKLLSKSGKFMFNRGYPSEYGSVGTKITTIPHEQIKVDYGGLSHFDIWDDRGFRHRFGRSLKNNSTAYSETNSLRISAWKVQEIISPNRKDTLSFEYYTEYRNVLPVYMTDDYVVMESAAEQGSPFIADADYYHGIPDLNFPFVTSRIGSGQAEVNSVRHDGNGSYFLYRHLTDSPPQYPVPGGTTQTYDRPLKYIRSRTVEVEIVGEANVSEIIIRAIADNTKIVKRVEFQHSFFGSRSYGQYLKRKLDRVLIYGENNVLEHTYDFDYYNASGVPYALNKNTDHWGYYNGTNISDYQSAVPRQNVTGRDNFGNTPQIYIGEVDKTPSAEYSKYGLLRSVTFPTGRKSTFHYEQNRRKTTEGSIVPTGGNRIHKIEEYEPTSGKTITRTFKYGLGEDGAGNIKHDVSLEDYKFSYTCLLSEPNVPYRRSIVDIYCSTPVTNIFYQNGAVVAYEHVTEYVDGKGKTEYEYSSIVNSQYRHPGTTVIEDRKEGDWQEVNLLQKTEYKYDPDSNMYLPSRKETNSYFQFHSGYIPYSLAYHKVRKYHANLFYSWLEDIYPPEELMLYVVREISTGSTHLAEQKIEVFDGERSSIQITTYNYGNSVNHRYLSRQTTSTNGQPVVTSYVYPQDINTAQARGLVENNVLATVLRQEKSVGSKKWVTRLQYDYMNNSAIPLPASLSEGPDTSNLRTTLEIKKYDAMGNPAYMVDKTKNIVYLWGYGGHKLIAEIQNATYDDIVTALSQARIDRILKGFALSTSDFDALNALRGLPDVSVTTIEYNSAFGISRITDQSGRNTNYNYDSAGRLCRITDDNDNPVEEYEYNYIN